MFETGLIDRFGPIPKPSKELINVVRLRWKAIALNIERIILKESLMICYLPSDPASKYYHTTHFQQMMQWILQNPTKCQVKEGKGKLSIIFKEVGTLEKAVRLLTSISDKLSA
jgi:transcription-repair coupling factor (superfamily II helicase)